MTNASVVLGRFAFCVMNKERPGKVNSVPLDAAKNSRQVRQRKREKI